MMSGKPATERQSLMTAVSTDDIQEKEFKTLRQSAPSWFWRVGLSATLITIPLVYIVMIVFILKLKDSKQSDFGDDIIELLQTAATLWPISFAAVMGPLLKTVALFSAERGSTFGKLEFLLASQTTVAALKNIMVMKIVRIWTVGIVALWSLSPLGGQAALRSLYRRPNLNTTDIHVVSYLGGNISNLNLLYGGAQTDPGVFAGADMSSELIAGMRNFIVASFYRSEILVSHSNRSSPNFDSAVAMLGGKWQAARLGERDPWRNVRIPFMELLPQYDAQTPNEWISVPSDMVVPYASLIGIPVRSPSFPKAGNSTFVVQSHYQTLRCRPEFNGTSWVQPGSTRLCLHNTSSQQLTGQGTVGSNGAFPNIWFDLVNNSAAREHLSNPSFEPASKLQLVMGSNCLNVKNMLRICDISTSYIDIRTNCTKLSPSDDLTCRADEVRHTPGFPTAGNLTALSNFRSVNVLLEMPFSTASYHPYEASLLEKYLKDPTSTFMANSVGFYSPPCYANVSHDIFGARLSTALNTAIMAMYNGSVLAGGDGISVENRNAMWYNGTGGTWSEFTEDIYFIRNSWFCLFVLSTLVMFISAVANIVIRQYIKAPDFLDTVTGLARDSPFLSSSGEGSGRSGSDKLRELKHTKVRICDVKSDSAVGRIALTTEVKGSDLKWKRLYE